MITELFCKGSRKRSIANKPVLAPKLTQVVGFIHIVNCGRGATYMGYRFSN